MQSRGRGISCRWSSTGWKLSWKKAALRILFDDFVAVVAQKAGVAVPDDLQVDGAAFAEMTVEELDGWHSSCKTVKFCLDQGSRLSLSSKPIVVWIYALLTGAWPARLLAVAGFPLYTNQPLVLLGLSWTLLMCSTCVHSFSSEMDATWAAVVVRWFRNALMIGSAAVVIVALLVLLTNDVAERAKDINMLQRCRAAAQRQLDSQLFETLACSTHLLNTITTRLERTMQEAEQAQARAALVENRTCLSTRLSRPIAWLVAHMGQA